MLDPIITDDQTKAKEPIDQDLMDAIRLNLERINGNANEALAASGGNICFKINGRLGLLNLPSQGQKLDGAFLTTTQEIRKAQVYLKEFGSTGTLSFDINRRKLLNLGIDRIQDLFTGSIQQVAKASSDLDTQGIERAIPSTFTQAVDYLLAPIGINSIINVTGTQFRINLDGTGLLDTDLYKVGDYVNLDQTDTANNEGNFQIVEVNRDNGYNLVLNMPAGSNQTIQAGNLILLASSYLLTSIAEPEAFEEGELIEMSGHTDPSNDGTFTIFKTNYGGNNIVVKKTTEVIAQGAPAGEIKTNRYKYIFLGAVNEEAFAVGENVLMAGHVDSINNGTVEIKAVNFGGNNIIIYNPFATLQAIAQGTATSYRYAYLLNVDPTNSLEVGDSINVTGCSNAVNNGTFEIKVLNFNATDSFVVYNPAGVAQPLPAGTASKTEKVIVLYEDPSPFFLADQSSAEVLNTQGNANDGVFIVKDVNRQGVSTYNLVVEIAGGAAQTTPAGQVVTEISSIFTSVPSFTVDKDLYTIDLSDQLASFSYEDGTLLTLDLLQAPSNAVDLSVNIK